MIRDEDVPRTTLASRAVPGALGLRRDLLWRGLHDADREDRVAPEIWTQLRNQAPLAAPPDGPLFSRSLGIFPPFALFAPNMGLTLRLGDVFGAFLRDYARRAACILEGDLIMGAIHLFLRTRWRPDVVALDLSALDQIQPDMLELPQRRREMMLDCGLGKVRLRGGWVPLDETAGWNWGPVNRVFMLVRPSLDFRTVRERVGNLEGLKRTGHWVLVVYDRRIPEVVLYDSKEYVEAKTRIEHTQAVWNILLGYGIFSENLVIDPTTVERDRWNQERPSRLDSPTDRDWTRRMAEWRDREPQTPLFPPGTVLLRVPDEPVRLAYSQAEDWECGSSAIHMARVLLSGQDVWEAWASPVTKRHRRLGTGRLTSDPFVEEFSAVTVPQRRYARDTLLRATMRDLVAYLRRMRDSGLWRIQ